MFLRILVLVFVLFIFYDFRDLIEIFFVELVVDGGNLFFFVLWVGKYRWFDFEWFIIKKLEVGGYIIFW